MIERIKDDWMADREVSFSEGAEFTQRFFLRTPVNPDNERDITFIGINPSSATSFGPKSRGGDVTTERITKFFPLDEGGAPRDWRTMTIINLIPLVAGSAKRLPNCCEGEAERMKIMGTLDVTRQVFEMVLGSSDCVHLMWGNPDDLKFPWKKTVLKELVPLVESLTRDTPVQAYLSPKGFPYHCGSHGTFHWKRISLTTDAHFLLRSS